MINNQRQELHYRGTGAVKTDGAINPFISVYVHFPYCAKKCSYCDFNSYQLNTRQLTGELEDRYIRALLIEIEHCLLNRSLGKARTRSVFLGGGTPSLFSPESISRVLGAINRVWPFSADAEITIESNPGSLTAALGDGKLAGFRSAGVTRISLGCQSFSAAKLAFLGRIHSAEDIPRAVQSIRRAGFDNLNFDLIYGIADETPDAWLSDLRRALELTPQHISAYCLTVEPGTEFGIRQARGERPSQSDDSLAGLYELTAQLLDHHRYLHYEVSNFALDQFRSEHNWTYWHGGDYLGFGAGAHSYIRRSAAVPQRFGIRWANQRLPEVYITETAATGRSLDFEECLSREQAVAEFLFLRLRCIDGFTLAEYQQEFDDDFLCRYQETIQILQQQRLLAVSERSVRLTNKGLLLMDSVLEMLLCM